ncbi:unnamed protein product [Bursaphelenchus okinawaensis]|uniref:Uncharacterized protein n=1 Tax=Bursaphelenchus okinawaensis TaxID=465554 RepID=A0A811KH50_9BILA|nr:unnamed protein product [Bursaphelenchus okinawaensis]CAG9103086.1 unnamed protein product [Bursaphelenchus okinawaensis]
MTQRRTLKDDSELIEKVKSHFNQLESRIRQVDESTKDLYYDTELLYNSLEDANNRILLLKNLKYVKEVIVDNVVDHRSIRSQTTQPSVRLDDKERAQRMVSTLKSTALKGLVLVNERYKEVEIPQFEGTSTDLLPKRVFEPVNPYLLRDLPPVIGTDEFSSWDYDKNLERDDADEFSEVVVKKSEVVGPRIQNVEAGIPQSLSMIPSSSPIPPPPSAPPTSSTSNIQGVPTTNKANDYKYDERILFDDEDDEDQGASDIVTSTPAVQQETAQPQNNVKDEIEKLFKIRNTSVTPSAIKEEANTLANEIKGTTAVNGINVEKKEGINDEFINDDEGFFKEPVQQVKKVQQYNEKKIKEDIVAKQEIKGKVDVVISKKVAAKPKSSIFSDSDDSFDEVFNVKPKQNTPSVLNPDKPSSKLNQNGLKLPQSSSQPHQPSLTSQQPSSGAKKPSPRIAEPATSRDKTSPRQTEPKASNPIQTPANERKSEPRKKVTSKVRSLFDSSSSDEELFTKSTSTFKTIVQKPTKLFSDSEEELVVSNKREDPEEKHVDLKKSESLEEGEVKKDSEEENANKDSEDEFGSHKEAEDVEVESNQGSEDEEMPKAVLNSVPNDFSNRLNAALLRKPPQPAFIPKLKDPEEVSVKSTSSAGSQKASVVDSGPNKSVSALRNQLGDSLTKIHGAKLGVKTEEKKDSIPSRSPTPPQLPSPAVSQPQGQMNFSAVKARPRGPAGRRPTSQAVPPPQPSSTTAQKPPTATTPSKPTPSSLASEAAKKSSESPKKPAEVTKKTSESKKQVKSLFESDSDDPF